MKKTVWAVICAIVIWSDYCMGQQVLSAEELPRWLSRNIHFPEEAYRDGVVGCEYISVGISWDGKAFLASRPNTLSPAYEKELFRVVAAAPVFAQPVDLFSIWQFLMIDFTKYAHPDSLARMQVIARHSKPRINIMNATSDNSREKLVEWAAGRYKVPASVLGKEFCDTLTVIYTICPYGKVRNVKVSGQDAALSNELSRVFRRSPLWAPAMANGRTIQVKFEERIVVKIGTHGKKEVFASYRENSQLNSADAPDNVDMIIANPDIKVSYNGKKPFTNTMYRILDTMQYDKGKPMSFKLAMVVEQDGTVSDLTVANLSHPELKSDIERAVRQVADWTPAKQGGKEVRSVYTVSIWNWTPRTSMKETDYAMFGKYYLPLISHSDRTRYSSSSQMYVTYPMDRFGVFYPPSLEYYRSFSPQSYYNVLFQKYSIFSKP